MALVRVLALSALASCVISATSAVAAEPDALKYSRLGGDWHLTFGGSARLRMESDWNKQLKGPPHETDDLARLRAYLNLEIAHAHDFRWYAEIRAA